VTKQPAGRWRLIAARTLIVLAAVLAVPAALAGYIRWQALDAGTFRGTSEQLIANDTVRDQIAATLVDRLYANANVTQALEQRLPPDQKGLAAPLAAASRVLADRLAPELMARPRVQQLWVDALSESQRRLILLLDDKSVNVQEDNGNVVLNLQPLIIQLGDRVAILGNVAGQLPPDAGKIVIMKADQLQTAQDLTGLLKTIGSWFWIIPFLLMAAGIALARGRRRVELRAAAIAVVIVGLLILVTRSLAGGYIVDALVKAESVKPAANSTWEILTDLLTDTGWTLIGLGLAFLFGVWVAGDTGSGRAARRTLAPVLGKRTWAFGIAGLLFLLLLWWQPTAQTGRPLQMFVLAIVVAIGVEALYRLTVRDFPEEAAMPPGAMFHRRRSDEVAGT
jgi:hypothetical protein